METRPEDLAKADRAYLIAAAGCGKTEIIARAVSVNSDKKQLILTHTNAGVHSLKARLKRLGISSRNYRVDTIARWALRYVTAYPQILGVGDDFIPVTNEDWRQCYAASSELLRASKDIRRVVTLSYEGVYIDEYQDCTIPQHNLVCQLAELMPCRLVGDPLQGIFDFSGDIVDWNRDISTNFKQLPELVNPWRWNKTNPLLGRWLTRLREKLLVGEAIDLRNSHIKFLRSGNHNTLLNACKGFDPNETVIGIREVANQCHSLARNVVKWGYTSIEEMEAKDLIKWVTNFESVIGNQRAVAVIDFCSECMTEISTSLKSIKTKFSQPSPDFSRVRTNLDVIEALQAVSNNDDFSPILSALDTIARLKGALVFRRELFGEMKRTLKIFQPNKFATLEEAAKYVRNQTSIMGRWSERRVISRTLLVKGLEFDHSVVFDGEKLNKHHLYVAMTRGTRSLTMVSKTPILQV